MKTHARLALCIGLFTSATITCLSALSWAESVVPRPTFSSAVIVREAPSSLSAPIGELRRGESATLLEAIPYWYHVHLGDGTLGYVSKVSTSVIEEPSVTIRLGAWNMKKLGHGSSKDFTRAAQVIADHFDIVAVVEVMQKQGGHPGYDALLSSLGRAWSGMVTDSPRPNTNAGHAEFYAIVYRTSLIRPCPGWNALVYHIDNDGSPFGIGPDHFSREPAFACFQAPVSATTAGIDFMLAAYHARWGDGNRRQIEAEARHLKDVFEAMAAARAGERDLLIAGDFNLTPTDLRLQISLPVNTEGDGSTLNSSGAVTLNLYDHILVYDDTATQERIDLPHILNVIGVATSPQGFYRTLSDHLPVVLTLDASGPDDD